MTLTRRELRVVNAFINCIKTGEYTESYAITLIEDDSKYGWMSDESKDYFYEELEKLHPEPEPELEPEHEQEEEQGEGE